MRTSSSRTGAHEPRERAALVGLFNGSSRNFDPEHSLDELAGLAAAAGADVPLRVLQERPRPDPATFLGSGKVTSLALMCDEARVDTVIFDNELTPAQLRNLETALDRKVVDRTQLILDIFARRARTREGKLQVELAQLKYLLPRLVGSAAALSRLGGGIGTRGPGETKLETDRRRIRHRISVLSGEIDVVRRRRTQLRDRRHKAAVPTVALVGYTNAGKTHAVQPADRRGSGGVRRAVRHAGSAGAQGEAAGSPRAAGLRHGRVHRSAAALARRGVSRHARGSGRSRPAPARRRRVVADRARQMEAVTSVLSEVGARACPGHRGLQQVGSAGRGGTRPAARAAPRRAVHLGAERAGARRSDRRDGDAARARHRADQRHHSRRTATSPERGWRSSTGVGRIHRHVTAEDAVSIEVDIPRRLLTRFDDVRVDA